MTIAFALLVISINLPIVSSGEGELSSTSSSCYGESTVGLRGEFT